MAASVIRNSAKAIIVEEGRLLVICRDDPQWGEWRLLPGGGQYPGETLHQTLAREAMEETSLKIEIGPLFWIREYIGAHHQFAGQDDALHQVEFMFFCRRLPGVEPAVGHSPDTDQVRVEWLDFNALEKMAFYPLALIPRLRSIIDNSKGMMEREVYLGDIN